MGLLSQKGIGKLRRKASGKAPPKKDKGLLEDGGRFKGGMMRVKSPTGGKRSKGR